jgi:hypothetical protein
VSWKQLWCKTSITGHTAAPGGKLLGVVWLSD